jgi:sterol desaturase/sphingolipid hydroxylase (fatty acid hydroxylase superfamily)
MAGPAPGAPFDVPDVVTLAIPGFVILVVAEMIYVRLTGKGRYNAGDSAASLAMGLGNSIVGALPLGLAAGANAFAYEHRLFTIGWTWWAMLACFFFEDLAYYWFHRVSHERRFFWASHVVHHSSQHYNLSTALRQTWTSKLAVTFIFWLPLIYIGFPPAMVGLFSGISLVYQFWIHTEAIHRMGPLEWVLNTPSHHRVHHATNAKYLDANYAGVLIIWDRLFGTFVAEDDAEKPRYGIISNLATLNPFRIAFHECIGIARDLVSARKPNHVLGYLLGPPGWSPDGSRKTSKSIKAAAAAATAAAE